MPQARKSKEKSARTKGPTAEIGVIGGSGLYAMEGLKDVREVRVKTPFGDPSDAFVIGTVEGKRVAFLARHGRGHLILPTELNFRANIYALKLLGVERIISVSAVGSLQEEIRPGEFLVPDQFFDSTKGRKSTFFGNGIVAHVTFDKPTCADLSAVLSDACVSCGVPVHRKGTYICMEGPQFSTLAEANFHRAMKFDVIGMTNVTEAKLAREAELCYSTIAMITDYDCWHPDHDSVTVATIIATLNQNATNAQNVLKQAIKSIPADRACRCGSALKHAILTNPKLVPAKTKKTLAAILGKYLS
ncbi:MAG TPA: S-methyl-5'-thioadenosine phosphorylase [Candidatus Saccharimonadales bacterium]|nr:S-methyl-5'-thioadenosine phosphorylase [Candidatus Saccharimonadales bacterium]